MKQIKMYSGVDELPKGRAGASIQKGCLVIEGGAFRGLYNQGALDALMLHDVNFQTVIGVSAGALAGMNYVSGQIGRSAGANLRFRHDHRYIGVKAFAKCGSILNVDFLLKPEKDITEIDPFDEERFYDPVRHFVAVVSNCDTGEAEYLDQDNCQDMLAALKASASMPFISPMVKVDGKPCLDGGCVDKVPYQWAIDQSFEKIFVIRTRERSFRKKVHESNRPHRIYRHHPEFAEKLVHINEVYNAQCEEMEKLEKEGRIFVLAPERPVEVGRLEKDMEKLGDLYWEGYHDMEEHLEELKEYLR